MKEKQSVKDHIRKIWLSCIFVLVGVSSLMSAVSIDSRKIRVRVLDGQDKRVLPYAHLHSLSGVFYVCDSIGEILLPPRAERYEVHFIGYKSQVIVLSEPYPDTLNVLLDVDESILDEIEVAEDRLKREHSASLRRINQSQLTWQSDRSMAEVLSNVAGVRIQSTGALIAKPIVEGMGGSRIVLVNNGAKLSGQHWGDDHAPELDIPSYAKVSVIKGAAGVKYGSNALAGVVLVDTDLSLNRKAREGTVGSMYATNGRAMGVNAGFLKSNRRVAYRLGAKWLRSGSYRTANYLVENTGSLLLNLQGDVAYRIGKWRIGGHLTLFHVRNGIYSGSQVGNVEDLLRRYQEGRPPQELLNSPFTYHISAPYQNVQHATANIHAKYPLKVNTLISLRYTYQNDYRREYSIRRGVYAGEPDFAFRLHTHQLQTALSSTLNTDWRVETGLSGTWKNNSTDKGTGAVPSIPNYSLGEIGAYFVSFYTPQPSYTLEGGMRVDYQRSDAIGYNHQGQLYGDALSYLSSSGSLGARYRWTPSQEWNIHMGLAWRAPEVNELYSQGIHHGEAVYKQGDTSLKTEKGLKMSSGYEADFFNGALSLRTHGFLNYVFDYIYASPRLLSVNGVWQPEVFVAVNGVFPKYYYQQSTALFWGGDVGIDIKTPQGVSVGLQGEWVRASNKSEGGYFPGIPADKYRAEVGYKFNIGVIKSGVQINGVWVAKQTRSNEWVDILPNTPAGYGVFGAACSFTIPAPRSQQMDVYLRADNLFNKEYKDYTNRLRYFLHERGRNITVGMSLTF